jgi:Rrf2 family iron-sulfur cluster assembly transcriptional regulator
MMLTTKARYAVMAIVDMAAQGVFLEEVQKATALSDIANRQDITVAYLEQIFCKLKSAGIVRSQRGPGGGYLLTKPASEIVIAEVINAVEEPMKMTRCGTKHEPNHKGCIHSKAKCTTHKLWEGLENQIQNYLGSITIDDVLNKRFIN